MADERTENLVIGSGIAGLCTALKLAEKSTVMLICKNSLFDCNTSWAQGGIAASLSGLDSSEQHFEDTVRVGAGLCHAAIVRSVVNHGKEAITQLERWGVNFSRNAAEEYHFTREAGHSQRRVLHAADTTGAEIMRALVELVRSHPNIELRENQLAVDLLTSDKYAPDFSLNRCVGAYVMEQLSGAIYKITARNTFLCTGGHGKVYLYTSNPDSATGDGLAMGWRAGCKVANLEFMQFHPTCLFVPAAKNFLISEAVRGEGATLINTRGHAFIRDYHPDDSLAPRDVVARAIDFELKKTGESHVYIDMTKLGHEKITKHFPNIYQTCLRYGIDISKDLVPVVPAAHYNCGGLVVNEYGQTGVLGLYAIGEVACTGLHGANRLASNSLLESVVFSLKASIAASTDVHAVHGDIAIPDWNARQAVPADERVMLAHAWDEIRRLMWNYVGIVRSDERLRWAMQRVHALSSDVDKFYWAYQVSPELVELRNLVHVAMLTIRCAMTRKESRGIHYNLNYPEQCAAQPARDTVIW